MRVLLILVAAVLSTGCSTTGDGRQTFLGISRYDKDQCAHDQWVLKKRRLVYQRCFR